MVQAGANHRVADKVWRNGFISFMRTKTGLMRFDQHRNIPVQPDSAKPQRYGHVRIIVSGAQKE